MIKFKCPNVSKSLLTDNHTLSDGLKISSEYRMYTIAVHPNSIPSFMD